MRRISALVVLGFLTFSVAQTKNTWNELIPRGKEVDYRYEAEVDVATSLPDVYSSMFNLKGVLHVQAGQENEILLRLSDLNYTLDNGRKSEFPDKVPIKISDHLITLTTPFRIVQDEDGNFQELGVGEDEPYFILNVKKALASLFQVDWMRIRLDSTKGHSFIRREPGLYGNEENMYNVIPGAKIMRVEKMQHAKSFDYLYGHVLSNVNLFHCDETFEHPLTQDSQKVYTVDRTQNLLKKIENTGGIYYHPYQAKSSAFSNFVSQSLEMINTHDIQAAMIIKKEIKIKSLEFIYHDINTPPEIVHDKQVLIPAAQLLLQNLLNFTTTGKIDNTRPDFERGQLPARVQNILKHFDIPMLENLLKLLLQKDIKLVALFHQMLPYVGTQISIKFLITLIKEKRMDDLLAVKALEKLPFYIFPNQQIITESEVLLQLEGVSPQVQSTAMLTFGTLLQRVQKSYTNKRTIISNDIIEKYIKMILDKLKSSTTTDEKILCLNTLLNIKSPLLVKHIRTGLYEQWWNDTDLRYKAITVLHAILSENNDLAYEVFWPLFTDRTLSSDARAMALYAILKAHPSLSLLINIYWFMQTETDVDVYQLYYTYFETLTKTKLPCNKQGKLQAMQLMKYMRVPYRRSLTQYTRVDFFNRELSTGEFVDLLLIDTNDSLVFKLGIERTVMNLHMKPFSFYMRISGLHGKLLDDLRLNVKKQMKLFNHQQLIQNLLSIFKMDGVRLEYMFMKQNQIVFADSIKKSNFAEKAEQYMNYFKDENKDTIELDFDIFYGILLPTDIGFMLMPTGMRSIMTQHAYNFNMDNKNNILALNLNGKLKESIHYVNGFYLHNPIGHTWQGVAKMNIYETALPLNLDANINPQQDMLKISWKRSKNVEEDSWVTRSYVAHIVQNYDYENTETLKKFNPNTKNLLVVPLNNDLNRFVVKEVEDFNTGYIHRLEVFDTEDSKSLEEISELQSYVTDSTSIIDSYLKYLQFDDNFLSLMLRFSNVENNLRLMHQQGIKGVFIKDEPSRTNPLTSVDLSIRLSHEITKEIPSRIRPGMKINLKGTCSWKNEETLVKRWDTNINWELNNGHTQNSVKGQITRTIPGQTDYKICAEGMETYSETGLTGNMNILMSLSPEGTCKRDETSIDITLTGETLPDQLQHKHNFPSCRQEVFSGIHDIPSRSCFFDATSIRKYVLEMTSQNLPKEFQRWIESFMEFLKAKYYDHYSQDVSNESIKDKTKILLTYPISNDILDMEIFRQDRHHKLLALPAENFRRYGILTPDNFYYNNLQEMMHRMGLVHICSANAFNIMNTNNTMLPNVVKEDWILVVADAVENPEAALWIKRVNNKLALKLVEKMNILLVLPTGNGFTLTLDGKTVPNEPLLSNQWLMLMAEKNILSVLMKNSGTQIIYNINEMLIEIPKFDEQLFGKCLDHE